MLLSHTLILNAVGGTFAVVCIHTFCWTISLLCSSHVTLPAKLSVVGLYASAAWIAFRAGHSVSLVGLGVALIYFTSLTYVVHRLAMALRLKRCTQGAVCVFCFAGFLLLPALLHPPDGVLVLAWALAPASYSYCVDASRQQQQPSLKECLFFVLVNPVLVFAERGHRSTLPMLHFGGLARASLGVAVLGFEQLMLQPALDSHQQLAGLLGFTPNGVAAAALLALTWFLSQYAAHSGLASIYIGLLRQLGHEIPERYHYPFLAKSPGDFWRRWNIYLGSWIKRYVFFPMSLRLGRGGASPLVAQGAALFVAFAAVGLLHDAYIYAKHFELVARGLVAFVLAGAVVALAEVTGMTWRRVVSTSGGAGGTWREHIAVAASRSMLGASLVLYMLL
jgi:hypothetical protein